MLTVEELVRTGKLDFLKDAWERLTCGLYHIVNKDREDVPFIPNLPQRRFLRLLLKDGLKRHIIVKARQLGFSTLIALYIFDCCYWNPNQQASIVDLTGLDAEKKLDKIRYAYNSLPDELKLKMMKNNSAEMVFENGSIIYAAINARGGTNNILHVSELGPIAYEDATRAERIRTGAIPTVPESGIVIIESTYMGGKSGMFYDLIEAARSVPRARKTSKDYHLFFSSWVDDLGYTLQGDMRRVSAETHALLDEREKLLGRVITPGQRLWYQVTREISREAMFTEYPTTFDDIYLALVKGAIYAPLITKLRDAGQIYDFPVDERYPVYTSWDLGWSDSVCVWVWQKKMNRFDILGYECRKEMSAAQMVQVVNNMPWKIAGHFLPHDAAQHSKNDGKTYVDALTTAGLRNVRVVNRIPDVWLGINLLRNVLPRCSFNEAGTKEGLDALMAYHAKERFNGAAIFTEPVHDWSSHGADALRLMAEADDLNMIRDGSVLENRVATSRFGRRNELPSTISATAGYKL